MEALATSRLSLTQRQLEDKTGYSLGTINKVSKELTDLGYIKNGDIKNSGLSALEPYRAKRAVFIAAGFGSRMVPITFNTPKPLVRAHGKRIIDELIDAVLNVGIDEIYVVRGYLAEQFDQLLYRYPMIKFIENSAYNEANNISSALVARYMLSNAYVFEADLLLNKPELIKNNNIALIFLVFIKTGQMIGVLLLKTDILPNKRSEEFIAIRNMAFRIGLMNPEKYLLQISKMLMKNRVGKNFSGRKCLCLFFIITIR